MVVEDGMVRKLRAGFSGVVLSPEDPEYDETRRVHNGLIDKRPSLIAQCKTSADVTAAMAVARDGGLESRCVAQDTTCPGRPSRTGV